MMLELGVFVGEVFSLLEQLGDFIECELEFVFKVAVGDGEFLVLDGELLQMLCYILLYCLVLVS